VAETIRLGSVQMEHGAGDKRANLTRIEELAATAAAGGVQVLAFPECCITGYWFLRNLSKQALTSLAESVPQGPSSRRLLDLAAHHDMTIGAGLLEVADDGRLYNSYLVALPEGSFRVHRKLHAFISEHVSSGSQFTVFEAPQRCRLGVLTCYDNNIFENVRITTLMGAQVILAPHQTGGCDSPDPRTMGLIDRSLWENRVEDPAAIEAEFRGEKGRAWLMRWLPSRAHDNGVFMVFSNGVGVDDDEIRTGNAMILDPYGAILAETWKAADDLVVADADLSLIEQSTGRRWMKTRRPDLYAGLSVPTGIEEDTRKVRFDRKGV
jgi:predicted amidohydrolase